MASAGEGRASRIRGHRAALVLERALLATSALLRTTRGGKPRRKQRRAWPLACGVPPGLEPGTSGHGLLGAGGGGRLALLGAGEGEVTLGETLALLAKCAFSSRSTVAACSARTSWSAVSLAVALRCAASRASAARAASRSRS